MCYFSLRVHTSLFGITMSLLVMHCCLTAQFQQRDFQRNGTATFRYDEVSYHNQYVIIAVIVIFHCVVYSSHNESVRAGSCWLNGVILCCSRNNLVCLSSRDFNIT